MTHVMVRYRVKADRVEENEALVRAVYEELQETRPEGLRYRTVKCDDGVTFVHLATTIDDGQLREVAAFRRFRDGLDDRCEAPPQRTVVTEIGAYV